MDPFTKPNLKLSVASVLCVYTIWGIQPLYWQYFSAIPLPHILAHRILWSAVFLIPFIILTNRWKELIAVFQSKSQMRSTAICAFAIGTNWLVNIYAAATRQVVEASLGHYITPILTILIGLYVLKEKIEFYKITATSLAFIGVLLLTLYVGKLPVIALLLILSFTAYTFFKKISPTDALVGITAETLILLPFTLVYLLIRQAEGVPVFADHSIETIGLLISTGIFTSVPLLLFSYGVRGMQLSSLGFIQYYAPTISLGIGIFIFKETFSLMHFISFSFIWLAILIVVFTPLLKRNSLH